MEELKIGLHNEWKIVVKDAKTGKVKREVKGQNILLNQWWTRYLSANNDTCLSYIHFGSGTDIPVATNTKLKTPIGSKAATNPVTDVSEWKSDGIIVVQKSCRLEANEYVGNIIAEVGFAYSATTTGNLVTHSLITDMNGNALTITKNADEVIDIYGTFYFKIGWDFDGGKVGFSPSGTGNGGAADALTCASKFSVTGGFSSTNTWMVEASRIFGGLIANMPEKINQTSGLVISFNTANKKLILTITDVAVGAVNITGGIKTLYNSGFQVLLPCTGFAQPVITKEVVGTGDGTTQDFQTKFGFIRNNGTFKAFVNDVEVSATADYDRGYPREQMEQYLRYLPESESFISNFDNVNKVIIFENPYSSFGIDTMYVRTAEIYACDDAETWILAAQRTSGSGWLDLAIPAEYKTKKYWKVIPVGASPGFSNVKSTTFAASKNVHLDVVPGVGDTVAVTYQPDCIAKDDQHTLKNISITFTFNEYTP